MRAFSGLRSLPLIALALAATACVVSTDAVVPVRDAEVDVGLLGEWTDGEHRATVTRGPGVTYDIAFFASGDEPLLLRARLGRLGGRRILDVWPALPEEEPSLFLPGHLLVVLESAGEDLRLRVLEPDSLLAALGRADLRLTHSRTEHRLVLHALTADLRSALGDYLSLPGALDEGEVWRRDGEPHPRPVQVPCFEAAAWPEADRLFRGHSRWLGADVASSVDLGGGRTLWLFGDTWIDGSGRGSRQGATMVSNSVAVQTGADPSTATIAFYWGYDAEGRPAAFVPDRGQERHWFGSGVRVDEHVILFLSRTVSSDTGLGFEHVGWVAVLVENPEEDPSRWRIRPLEVPTNELGVLVGMAASFEMGEHVIAIGSQDPVKSHPIFAVRWRAADVAEGDLGRPEWWAGDRHGWVADTSTVPRRPLFENGQSELTIHRDPGSGHFWAVHTRGFGPADLVVRAAPRLTGPWTEARPLYRPPEYYRPNIMIYAGKAHPHLTGADLVLTYATNTFAFAEHVTDARIYYPRFVRLTRCN